MLDPPGIILTWNRGMQELLGYNRDEIVGHSGAVVFSAPVAFKKELARAKRSGESIAEHLNIRKGGSEVRVHDTTTSLRNLVCRLLLEKKNKVAIVLLPLLPQTLQRPPLI